MDHLSPLLKDIFSDSEIAAGYASASTKTTCMINGSLAPYFKSSLVNIMRAEPFSIAVDGSNDNGLEKMNPMTVRIYDVTRGKVVTQFLDMCLTKGKLTSYLHNCKKTVQVQVQPLQHLFLKKWLKYFILMEFPGINVLECL